MILFLPKFTIDVTKPDRRQSKTLILFEYVDKKIVKIVFFELPFVARLVKNGFRKQGSRDFGSKLLRLS